MGLLTLDPTIVPGKLGAGDLCDRCSAKALIRTFKEGSGALDFCGHHYRKYEIALLRHGFSVTYAVAGLV